jgi:hypothetical protein
LIRRNLGATHCCIRNAFAILPLRKDQESPMTRPIRILTLAVAATAALQLPMVSIASAQQNPPRATVKPGLAPASYQSLDMMPDRRITSQAAARTAHPITQGGTTGGTVNPGLTNDHMQHGYNGG